MARDTQVFIFTGRLGCDPELSYSRGGKAYCKAAVACNDAEKVDETWQDRTDWFNIVAFDKTAEFMGKLRKGQAVMVQGRLRSSKYEGKTGKGIWWEVRVQSIERLDRTRLGEGAGDEDDFSDAEAED